MKTQCVRDVIGLLAAMATGLQAGVGLGRQLYLSIAQGTDGLSFVLFFSSFLGMALWAAWAFMRPEGTERIIAYPNTLGAVLSLSICVAIIVMPSPTKQPPRILPFTSTQQNTSHGRTLDGKLKAIARPGRTAYLSIPSDQNNFQNHTDAQTPPQRKVVNMKH
jgi:hypothetical protein